MLNHSISLRLGRSHVYLYISFSVRAAHVSANLIVAGYCPNTTWDSWKAWHELRPWLQHTMASGCPRQGLSLSQRPRHLLTQVGGRRRSPHPKEKDDVQGSSEENRLPKKFTSVHDEPASTDKSGSSDDSDGGRTSRANIGRSQFLQSKASAKSSARERQKPEQTINRPQKRSTASSSSTRNAPVASAAKRRKRAVSDISDGDEDEDDDKSRAKGRLTSSGTSARSSSSKPPPSSSSGSHCQDEHGFVKSRQRPQQRTFGGNKTGVKASSGREKASKTGKAITDVSRLIHKLTDADVVPQNPRANQPSTGQTLGATMSLILQRRRRSLRA